MSADKKLRVLVVEDDRDMAFTISKLLMREFSVEVDTALDIDSAKRRIADGHYDLATIDYQLPDGDGIGLLDLMAAEGLDTRSIVITGHGDEKIAARAFEAGAIAYIKKDARLARSISDAFRRVFPNGA